MTEPDYTHFTSQELNDALRHIDSARFPDRAARLVAEIERREAMTSPEERRRAIRDQLWTQGAMYGGIAGAFSLPISFGILSAISQNANRARIPHSLFYDPIYIFATVPLGWLLGVAAGICWAALRVRRDGKEANALEVWRDAFAASVAGALSGCVLVPLLFVAFGFLLGILLAAIYAVAEMF